MITEIPKEIQDRFPEYVKEWRGYGLCTDPADRPRAENAIRWMYKQAGLGEPKIKWCESPLNNTMSGRAYSDSVLDEVITLAVDMVRGAVAPLVSDSVWDTVRESVGDSFRHSVWDSARDLVRDSVIDTAWASSFRRPFYGQHEADWLSFHHVMHDLGLEKETAPLWGLQELCKSAGWLLPYKEICWVSERHNICKLNDDGLVHCEDGPAIAYPDGFEIFALNGKLVSEDQITNPNNSNGDAE